VIAGRWKVVRRSSPQARRQWSGVIAAHLCRCTCGAERVVLDRDLKLGRSKGCQSRKCREAWALASGLAPHLGVDRARELAREIFEAALCRMAAA
jgi:hypothetical protein